MTDHVIYSHYSLDVAAEVVSMDDGRYALFLGEGFEDNSAKMDATTAIRILTRMLYAINENEGERK